MTQSIQPVAEPESLPGRVLIYTCANNGYEDFAPLFIASALWANESHIVEFGMPDPVQYETENELAVAFLRRRYGDRFVITQRDFPATVLPHTIRFITEPTLKAPFVYIVDSDLLFLDGNFPVEHLSFMDDHGLPYANSLRDRDRRMTGLHFTRWDAYYPLPDISDLNLRSNDEQILAEIVHRKGHPLHQTPWFRPVPGIHPSPNREPLGSTVDGVRIPGWGAQPWIGQWREFRSVIADLVPHLRGVSADVVSKLDEVIPSMTLSQTAFKQVFQTNKWENSESVSGPGSTKAATNELLARLADLISRHAITSLNDAPCGDFNWIAPVAEQVEYRGFDVVPDVIEMARSRADHPFRVLDIVEDVLPRADAILCRDCLVHLPEEMIQKAIRNFVKSGGRWLLTTTFPDLQENKKGALGGWRPINLQVEPFTFPEPDELLIERPSIPPHEVYGRKALGLWRLSSLDIAQA